MVPRYSIKPYSGCSCEDVLGVRFAFKLVDFEYSRLLCMAWVGLI